MKKYFFILQIIFLLILVFLVFRQWFFPGLISSGDLGFLHKSMLSNHPLFPYAWYTDQGNGLGGFSAPFLWIYFMGTVPVLFVNQLVGYNWSLIVRLSYLYPFLFIGIISISMLYKYVFPKNKIIAFAPLIFITNTYALMLVGGGQVLLALSYAITPLVLLAFLMLMQNFTKEIKRKFYFLSGLAGLSLAVQILFDFRFAYITFFAVILYVILFCFFNFKIINTSWVYWKGLLGFFIALIITLSLHAFWLLPTALVHTNPLVQLGSAYITTNAVQYFSFAKFENTFGLLHPNWPENIFGKVGFMRPEFLLLPILSFSSVFFIGEKQKTENKEEDIYIIYFALLGLLGVFLAKGANDPFGWAYLWMFNHVPGFIIFRDPTKWYLLIALSYSMLIPYTVSKTFNYLQRRFSK